MSCTREDARATSRRGLSSRRHNLCSEEDYISPAASLEFLHDRRDDFYNDINLIRHMQQFLDNKDVRNENNATFGVRFWRLYRSSTRLRVFERVARVALWGGVRLDAAMVSEARAFSVGGELIYHFPKRRPSDLLRRTSCGWSLFRRTPGWLERAARVRRHEAVRTTGISVCQGTIWSEELDGEEFHGAGWW